MNNELTIIKIGGHEVFEAESVYDDIKALFHRGEKIILVAGGSCAIAKQFQSKHKDMPFLILANGDIVRFCGSEQMPLIESAYRNIVFPHIAKQLESRGLSSFCVCACDANLVKGDKYPPLKIKTETGFRIERNSMVGRVVFVDSKRLTELAKVFDVVVIAPPISSNGRVRLNVDADMLASHLAVELKASSLHFLTATNGILKNLEDPNSTTNDMFIANGDCTGGISGRMKQKLRAASHCVQNSNAFVTISSAKPKNPVTQMNHALATHVWKFDNNNSSERLLSKMVQIPSPSAYEGRLANFLFYELSRRSYRTNIDSAGNIVGRIGGGAKKILLLGHLDTVSGDVGISLDGNILKARGSVDAKGCLAAFIEAGSHFKDSKDVEVLVIGAVEEEISSAKGGIFVRDNYNADAVIIGEPSNTYNITLGYNGMLRIEIRTDSAAAHSASKGYTSPSDQILRTVNELSEIINHAGIDNTSVRKLNSWIEDNHEHALSIINFRIPPNCSITKLEALLEMYEKHNEGVSISILRMDP